MAKRFGSEVEYATATLVTEEIEIDDADVYKGMHPAVRAKIESLRKFREDAEDKQYLEIAKKYELLGKKPEELAPLLKSLAAAGDTAYTDMIAMLDTKHRRAKSLRLRGILKTSWKGMVNDVGMTIKGDTFTTFDDLWSASKLSEAEKDEIQLKIDLVGKLIEARESKGISQKRLAEMSGLKQPAITRLERGQTTPQIDTLFKVLKPLGYTLAIVPDNAER